MEEIETMDVPQLKSYITNLYNQISAYRNQPNFNDVVGDQWEDEFLPFYENELQDTTDEYLLQAVAYTGATIWRFVRQAYANEIQAGSLANHWGFLLDSEHPAMKKMRK